VITDDDEENSIFIYLGMYKHLQEWWNMCKARGIAKEDHIHNIENKMWTKEDKERFQTDFKPQIYKKGDVRINSSLLPHSSIGPATKIRQIILL